MQNCHMQKGAAHESAWKLCENAPFFKATKLTQLSSVRKTKATARRNRRSFTEAMPSFLQTSLPSRSLKIVCCSGRTDGGIRDGPTGYRQGNKSHRADGCLDLPLFINMCHSGFQIFGFNVSRNQANIAAQSSSFA